VKHRLGWWNRSGSTARRAPLLLLIAGAVALLGTACAGISQPQGWAAPVVQDSNLYVTLERGKLSAYQVAAAPQFQWQFPVNNDERVPVVAENGNTLASPKSEKVSFEGFYGNPAVTDDAVFLTSYSGHVAALTRADGRARWVAQLPGRLVGGALVTSDTVYAGNSKGELFALDRGSGAVRWRRLAGNDIWATPVLVGDRIVIATMDGRVTAYSANGDQQWRAKPAGGAIAATPVVDGNRMYFGASDKRVYAIDNTNGATIWRSQTGDNWFWTELLLEGDTLYAGTLGGTVYAFPKDGNGDVTSRWQVKVGDLIRGRPALVNNVLVVGAKNGRIMGLTPSTGERMWELPVKADLFAGLVPTPAGVYVSTEGGRGDGRIFLLDVAEQRVRDIQLR
jgi:outer membrane protein assembly factor BamB